MHKLGTTGALAVLALAAGCSSGDTPSGAAATPTDQGSTAAPATAAPAPPTGPVSGAAGPVLTGTVGSEDDPDAFVITLADSSGQPVSTLPAGTYTLNVQDLSKIHNFHLKGGEIDATTTVPEVADKSFQVTLTAGQYTFVCDPHPRMVGSVTVT